MKIEDRVWLACAIDTDGWISIKSQKQTQNNSKYKYKYYIPWIGFHNNNKEIVDKFANLIDGKTYVNRYKSFRKSYTTEKGNTKIVKTILEDVLEFLIVKRRKAEYIIEYCNFRLSYPGDHSSTSSRQNLDEEWYHDFHQIFKSKLRMGAVKVNVME